MKGMVEARGNVRRGWMKPEEIWNGQEARWAKDMRWNGTIPEQGQVEGEKTMERVEVGKPCP